MYSKCQKCGKKLTDPESIKRGYGPECWNSLTAHYYRSPVDWENYRVPGQMNIEDFLDMGGGDNGTRPAVSRKDRKTEICPDCGTKQALDTVRDLLGPEMTDQQWEGYKSGFLKRSREGQHGQNTL